MLNITSVKTATGYQILVDGVVAVNQYHDKNGSTDTPVPELDKDTLIAEAIAEVSSYYS